MLPENIDGTGPGDSLVHSERIPVTGDYPVSLTAEAAGQGRPLVWSHGLLGSMAQDFNGGVLAWRDLLDIARVIRYDARGHGCSDSAGTPDDYTWARQASNLWELVNCFTEEPVVLGGASMGSGISLHAACQHPDRVKGLVLVTPPRVWEWRQGKDKGYRLTANIVSLSRGLPFRLLGRIPFSVDSNSFRKNVRGVMTNDLATADHRGVTGAMRGAALSDFPAREALAQLEIPTLILAWPGDDIHPLVVAEELHKVLRNSRLQVAEEENGPYAWPEQVREFIQSLD